MTYTKLAISGINLEPLIETSTEFDEVNPFEDYCITLRSNLGYKPIQIDLLCSHGIKSFIGIWDFSYWKLTPTECIDTQELEQELHSINWQPKEGLTDPQGIIIRTPLDPFEHCSIIWIKLDRTAFSCSSIERTSKGLFFTYTRGI